MPKNYHETLELTETDKSNLTSKKLNLAYIKKLKEIDHSRINDPAVFEKYFAINEAYQALANPVEEKIPEGELYEKIPTIVANANAILEKENNLVVLDAQLKFLQVCQSKLLKLQGNENEKAKQLEALQKQKSTLREEIDQLETNAANSYYQNNTDFSNYYKKQAELKKKELTQINGKIESLNKSISEDKKKFSTDEISSSGMSYKKKLKELTKKTRDEMYESFENIIKEKVPLSSQDPNAPKQFNFVPVKSPSAQYVNNLQIVYGFSNSNHATYASPERNVYDTLIFKVLENKKDEDYETYAEKIKTAILDSDNSKKANITFQAPTDDEIINETSENNELETRNLRVTTLRFRIDLGFLNEQSNGKEEQEQEIVSEKSEAVQPVQQPAVEISNSSVNNAPTSQTDTVHLQLDAFKKIYQALYQGQTCFFFKEINFVNELEKLEKKSAVLEKKINQNDVTEKLEQMRNKEPNGLVAKAWELAKNPDNYNNCTPNNTHLFLEIYKISFEKSSVFSQSHLLGSTFFSNASLNKAITKLESTQNSTESIKAKIEERKDQEDTRAGKIYKALR